MKTEYEEFWILKSILFHSVRTQGKTGDLIWSKIADGTTPLKTKVIKLVEETQRIYLDNNDYRLFVKFTTNCALFYKFLNRNK